MEFSFLKPSALVLIAALGYSFATIGMKLASAQMTGIALAFVVVGFTAATLSEIVLMKGISLGVLYLIIIGVETLVVLGYAVSIGEGLDRRQMLGGAIVLGGLAILSN